ncbi:hypothetical protein V8G54_032558 [Vigna mungo]|uniref:Transposase MuDR plant domain-containing protein n=1 Tax=Vigna mungo TaxID=3915 RepID=A0AAQ3MM71_VIGMU
MWACQPNMLHTHISTFGKKIKRRHKLNNSVSGHGHWRLKVTEAENTCQCGEASATGYAGRLNPTQMKTFLRKILKNCGLKPFQKLGYQFGDLGFRFVNWGIISIVVIRVVGPSSAVISSGQDIEVIIHHGGNLVNDGKLIYEGGETSRFMFDPDVWSYFVIVGVVKSLGYQGFKDMWYSVGGTSVLDDKLQFLCDDNGAMHMVNLARLNGEVHVFVIHPVSEPKVIHMLECVRNDEGQVEERGDMVDVDSEQQQMGEEEVDGVKQVEVEEVRGVLEEMGDVEGQMEVEEVGGVLEEMSDVEEVGGDGEHEGEEENEVEIRSWNSSFENGNGDGNIEWMEELVDVNVGCDIDDDIQANFEGNVEVEVQSISNESSGACDSVSSDSIFDVNVEGGNGRGLSDDDGAESGEEDTNVEGYGTFATFVLPKSMVDFKWEVGTYFAEKQDILEAIKSYALDNGRNIKFVKNDKQRMRFKCVGGKGKCPWRLYCGYMKAVKTWQLRTMLDNHTCSREFNLKLTDSKWLSKKIEKTIRENPKVKGFRFVNWGIISIVVIRVVGPSSAVISSGQDIEVIIHHGGNLVNDGKLIYEGGETSRFMFDPDVWSYFVIVGVVKSLGYQGFKDMWYSVGGTSVLDDKLQFLCDDNGAMHMVNLARLNGEVHVFVIHPVSEPKVIHMLECVRNDEGQVEERGDMVDVDSEQQQMGEEEVDGVKQVEVEEVRGVLEEMGDVEGQMEVEEVGGVLEEMSDVEEVGGDGEHEGEEENEVEIRSWNSSFENGNGDGNIEWMEELVDVNVGCDIDDDIQANFEGNVEVEVQSISNESSGACDSVSSDSIFDVNVEGGNGRGLSDDDGAESGEEDTNVEGYGTFATFVLPKSMVDFKWEVGTYFAEKQDILEAIKSYALDNGRNIKFVKNDKQRMRFKCVGGKGKCPWRLYCGYMKAVKTWQLRTMLDNHTCSREFNLKLTDSKWLSKKIEKTIRENPKVKGVDIKEKDSLFANPSGQRKRRRLTSLRTARLMCSCSEGRWRRCRWRWRYSPSSSTRTTLWMSGEA